MGHGLLLRPHGQLWRRHHPPDRHHEGPVLPAHDQEHDVDEGDAGPPAADQHDPVEVQERCAEDAARNHGALSDAQGQSARRVPSDGSTNTYFLCSLRLSVRSR